jgi:hypothetical protein
MAPPILKTAKILAYEKHMENTSLAIQTLRLQKTHAINVAVTSILCRSYIAYVREDFAVAYLYNSILKSFNKEGPIFNIESIVKIVNTFLEKATTTSPVPCSVLSLQMEVTDLLIEIRAAFEETKSEED